jgi:hypothetical protein
VHTESTLTKRNPARLKFQTRSLQYLFIFAVRQPAFGAPWRAWHNKKAKAKVQGSQIKLHKAGAPCRRFVY